MHEQVRLTDETVPGWLCEAGLLAPGEPCEVAPAGDGNINWVRRVRAPGRGQSWVVKQARPELERFPEYRVTPERMVFEQRWRRVVAAVGAPALWPRTLHEDERERALVMEDLGEVPRLDLLTAAGADVTGVARALGAFLGHVHAATWLRPDLPDAFRNDEMRRLHGEHIFVLPFRQNDFPLAPAVRARAERLWDEPALVAASEAAWARYLEPRGSLLHGDVQGGNVLVTATGPRLLDAEIAHVGSPAFDVGMLAAHLCADALARGEAELGAAPRDLWKAYEIAWSQHGQAAPPEGAEVVQQAGFELMRRTLGAARIAAAASERAALQLVDVATRWILDPAAAFADHFS